MINIFKNRSQEERIKIQAWNRACIKQARIALSGVYESKYGMVSHEEKSQLYDDLMKLEDKLNKIFKGK